MKNAAYVFKSRDILKSSDDTQCDIFVQNFILLLCLRRLREEKPL
jgi:hypothetical protein